MSPRASPLLHEDLCDPRGNCWEAETGEIVQMGIMTGFQFHSEEIQLLKCRCLKCLRKVKSIGWIPVADSHQVPIIRDTSSLKVTSVSEQSVIGPELRSTDLLDLFMVPGVMVSLQWVMAWGEAVKGGSQTSVFFLSLLKIRINPSWHYWWNAQQVTDLRRQGQDGF